MVLPHDPNIRSENFRISSYMTGLSGNHLAYFRNITHFYAVRRGYVAFIKRTNFETYCYKNDIIKFGFLTTKWMLVLNALLPSNPTFLGRDNFFMTSALAIMDQ